jgi:3-oxoacyl-[acyl-carrier-protein] synthase-3
VTPTEAYIGNFAYALGPTRATVEAAESRGGLVSTAEALRQAGFRQHWTSGPDLSAYDLACRAVEQISAHLVGCDAIVYATSIPANASLGNEDQLRASRDVKHLMDFPASHLQTEFGLESAFVVGLDQQACTGMLGSIRVARALLLAEPELNRVLCVTADRFPEGALYEQAYNLISDGAAACIVSSATSRFRILACHGVTNGGLVTATDDETLGSFFSYSHRVIKETLARAGLGVMDIDHVAAQNTNPKAWQILGRMLGIDPERVHASSLPDVAHVIACDNIINLIRLLEEDRVAPGERVLMLMAGYGMHWQCVILEKC